MSGRKQQALIPRLRFPEFRNAGPWEVRSIEDLAEKIAQGGTPQTSIAEYWDGEIPWLTPAEMGDDAIHHYTEKTQRTISRKGLENSATEILPVNSVIISSRAPIGYVTINKVEMATNQGCKGIIPKEKIYHEFLYFSLLVSNRKLNDFGAGSGFKEISTSTLRKFKIPVPSYKEQQKIADCLSSLDELIQAEEAQLEALRQHKKGLMQKLFPAPGETTPRLRFPEFRNAGPWEVKRLEEVCEILDNMRKPVTRTKRKPGPYPYYGASGAIDYIDEYIFDERLLLIGEDGAKWGPFEKTSFIVEGKYWVNNHAHVLRPVAINDVLLENYLNATDVSVYVTGAAPPKLTLNNLKSIRVPLPPVQQEQQKIADCLSSLDELIQAKAARIDALKTHKRGLMQQLFPHEVV